MCNVLASRRARSYVSAATHYLECNRGNQLFLMPRQLALRPRAMPFQLIYPLDNSLHFSASIVEWPSLDRLYVYFKSPGASTWPSPP